MRFEMYQKLKMYAESYPNQLETLTEKEFRIFLQKEERRKEDGNFHYHDLCGRSFRTVCI